MQCYDINSSFTKAACNCFGQPMLDGIRTEWPIIRVLVSSWPGAAVNAFLLKIVIEEKLGFPVLLIPDYDPVLGEFQSVIDGLEASNDVLDLHPEVRN